MIPALVTAGVVGLLAIAGNELAQTRIRTTQTPQTTAARTSSRLPPQRAAVTHPRHRRP